jgi:hypothetical protein
VGEFSEVDQLFDSILRPRGEHRAGASPAEGHACEAAALILRLALRRKA